jgi:phosphatidylinositol glycan class B
LKKLIISPYRPWLVYLLSTTALLILVYFSVGYYHPDEHFQILEFARWKLDPSRPEPLPWEFYAQIRPAIQPAMVVVIHKFLAPFGCSDPFLITFVLRLFSASLSFLAMWMIYQRYKKEISNEMLRKWFLCLSFLLWFALYNAVRFTSETWSGAVFLIGFSYLFLLTRTPRTMDFFVTGVLLGFSFLFRYQTGFLIAGYFLWFFIYRLLLNKKDTLTSGEGSVNRVKMLQLVFMALGILGVIGTGVLIDRWFYGNWVLTAWNYFDQNILADKISSFGILPWWFYFEDIFIRTIPPFSLIFFFGSLIVFIMLRNDLLTWTLLPFILIHVWIGHKETRFFYPLIGFLPVLVIKGIWIIKENWSSTFLENKFVRIFAKIFWIVNCSFILLVFFIPADSQVNLYKKIYRLYPYPITLYYISDDPYRRALDISYYKRRDLSIEKAGSVEWLDSVPDKKYLVAIKRRDPGFEKVKNHKQVYSTFPEWMKYFNFNHWQDRTQIWYLFETFHPWKGSHPVETLSNKRSRNSANR